MEEKPKAKDMVVWTMIIMIMFAAIGIALAMSFLNDQDKITTEYIFSKEGIE